MFMKLMFVKIYRKMSKKSEKMRSCGTPCKCLDFGPFSGVRKTCQKSRFFLWFFVKKREKKDHRSRPFFEKKFLFLPGVFGGVSRGCTSRFLECTKMIGIIWESVLRVPILLLLSDGFFGGPARGPEKKVFKKCSFFDSIFRGKNDTVFEVKKVVKKWVKNDPKNDPQNDPQNDPRNGLAGPLVNCLALTILEVE